MDTSEASIRHTLPAGESADFKEHTMHQLSPSKVIEAIRASHRVTCTAEMLVGNDDAIDSAEAALESGDSGLAQRYFAEALEASPHSLGAQVGLIETTPKLSTYDKYNLFREIYSTYQRLVLEVSAEDQTPLSLGTVCARNMLYVVSKLASHVESIGKLEEGAKLREWALSNDRRDGWGHRFQLAGYYLLVGNARRLDALLRSNIRGRYGRYPEETDPFWILVDLVNALIKGEERAEKIYSHVEKHRIALRAVMSSSRPIVDLDEPYTKEDVELRWAFVLWPAVHVHEQAISWLRQRTPFGGS